MEMGLDLHLLALHRTNQITSDFVWDYDHMVFERDYNIFCQLTEIEGKPATIESYPIPPNTIVELRKDSKVIRTRKDGCNNILRYVYAEQLQKKLVIPEDTMRINKAIKAYISKLKPETPIILYWQ